jgi:hypothetical protein
LEGKVSQKRTFDNLNGNMRTIYGFALCFLVLATGCTKEAGEGGRASIRGIVEKEIRLVLSNPNTFQTRYPAPDQEVFIVYGDALSPSDRIHTNYDGEFEFTFLREGKYTIYVYSNDTTGNVNADPNRMPIIREVEITDRKQELDLGRIRIYDQN